MQSQHAPVLIFAQSGRFLAQSATQAGYRVWVADCFGDQDTLDITDRWHQLSSFPTLSIDEVLTVFSAITQGENCKLICGSGIESIYPLLQNLPSNIKLIGNTANTIHQVKTPKLFFNLLRQQQINYPETLFKEPKDKSTWLIKSASGLGGVHIQYLKPSTQNSNSEHYYQRFISGLAGSALFLANGQEGSIICINQQHLAEDPQTPFCLGSIDSPWLISDKHKDELQHAIHTLTLKAGLVGLNSLDFIISDLDTLLILEVNPRVSASAELFGNKAYLFREHLNACNKKQLSAANRSHRRSYSSLQIIYSEFDTTIPKTMIWPKECSDLSTTDSLIQKNSPICTSVVHATTRQHGMQRQSAIKQYLIAQLHR